MKKLGPKYIKSKLNTPMLNYREYYFSASEKMMNFVMGFFGGGIVGLVFYGGLFRDADGFRTMATYISDLVIFLIVGMIGVFVVTPIRRQHLSKKREILLTKQFRSMLVSLSTSLSGGMNMQEAIEAAHKDLIQQYTKDSLIVYEVEEMLAGTNNNVPLEDTLRSFGERSGIDDITNFGVVFAMTFRTGASLKEVVRRTDDIIGQKIEIKEQIQTAITSNRTQFLAMMIVPVVIVMMLRLMSSSFAESFATVGGVIANTVAIVIFVISYFMGMKILDVRV